MGIAERAVARLLRTWIYVTTVSPYLLCHASVLGLIPVGHKLGKMQTRGACGTESQPGYRPNPPQHHAKLLLTSPCDSESTIILNYVALLV